MTVSTDDLFKANLRTPRAAAIAGIVFSILLLIAFWLLRISVPKEETVPPGGWLGDRATTIALALNLIPFAGIAFLWFIGVMRDRLGHREDRFFATVFLGSGLLFLATLFSAAAVAAAILAAFARPGKAIDVDTFTFVRTLASDLMNVHAVRMAGVFMISTSTVALRTDFAPRYIGILGYGLAVLLLFGNLEWSFFVFPAWVLLLSIHILIDNLSSKVSPQEPRGGTQG